MPALELPGLTHERCHRDSSDPDPQRLRALAAAVAIQTVLAARPSEARGRASLEAELADYEAAIPSS